MIDHQQIKTAFVGPLRNYLGVTVQMQDQAVPQPPYPFIGFTSLRHTLISRHMVFIQSARIGTGSKNTG
ncbi:phage neck terminator protein [Paenibacillus melissococcoides]|uniref:phage neck terminator protein n=1 Tax=Paenibacillus melissococcoides TaxID=2912268 RepID=UPI0036F29F82